MRLLAIDYGKKRCGIAVTDNIQLIANGLTTVATAELIPFLTTYFSKEDVEKVIIGSPKQTNGLPSENYKRVQQFIQLFRKTFSEKPIVEFDERFTSILAQKAILDSGLKKHKRQNKALVDEVSACIILQDFMNFNNI